jgi:hypothetical protein
MIAKKVSVLLGISLMLPSSFLIADTAFDRALGKGVTQNYQGLDRSGREVYPGVWSQGREERSTIREEVYPGVWRTRETSSGYEGDMKKRNSSGSGITIVNRATGRSGGDFNVQDREQDRNFQSTNTRSSQQQASSPSTGSQPTSNQRVSSSSSGFSGRSTSNTRTPSIPGVTEREREYTNISSLIDPDFD